MTLHGFFGKADSLFKLAFFPGIKGLNRSMVAHHTRPDFTGLTFLIRQCHIVGNCFLSHDKLLLDCLSPGYGGSAYTVRSG
ncbi:hypothetical protein EVA_04289 [gut metagenome]|uniref:Uncharacterized protein n=1 Tax=gut metagenome TaxID=749906 RepID=J9D4L9_9ZZZZ